MALKRRQWSSSHEAGWATRRYRRKIGCTVALDANHGYDMTIGGDLVEGEPDGEPGTWDVVGTREARLLLPWAQGEDLAPRPWTNAFAAGGCPGGAGRPIPARPN